MGLQGSRAFPDIVLNCPISGLCVGMRRYAFFPGFKLYRASLPGHGCFILNGSVLVEAEWFYPLSPHFFRGIAALAGREYHNTVAIDKGAVLNMRKHSPCKNLRFHISAD